ncbi:transglutaminase-like domain-containing protein [Paenibacillus woosongensis]|uniref:DUF4129 domain-containing protein n=1 Tax=Paenibacillus woosongensis TaxID=307580 RepID=A0A7X2Z1R0_9BACL|nr:transglutaminase-like domain-containing protein [Paenibacillus woosongensis]MUG45169.1 DUF4129 domain-containing protein [Paenibacillus woosongensis]
MNNAVKSPEPAWYRLFVIVWMMIIGMQWIDYTEPIWYQETTALVTATLFAVALCEALLHSRPWLNWTLKSFALIVILRIILGIYIYYPSGPVFPDQARQLLAHSSPYIWFALAAWGLFDLLIRLLTDRAKVIMFLSCNLLALTILDSFTSYYLWGNVAWLVFAGLGWLVCLHFRKFQLKYPQGWVKLRKEPLKITLNIVVIFASVLLIGVSMPAVSPILTDPYTAWKKRGAAVQAPGPGAVPSSETSIIPSPNYPEEVLSGYSRDDTRLGDGFEFSYSPVMNVISDVRSYWRGETRRIYTGAGWADLDKEGRDTHFYAGGGDNSQPLVNRDAGRIETRKVEQIVTMQTDKDYPVLFGGYAISSVEVLDEEPEARPRMHWAGKEAELRWSGFSGADPGYAYPKRYKVTAEIPVIPVEELRQASYDALYSSRNVNGQYLQIPANFPQRVRELAEEVTAEGATPYEKMELLQAYLRQNYEYTNKPDLTRKQSEDFVDSFLFEIKQGYCDYYSTSMVMMARSLQIPARWVKGYAPGSMPTMEMMQRFPEMETGYSVSNSDAHSWAELYFGEEYGWIPFEATPGFDTTLLTPEEESVDTWSEDLAEDDASSEEMSNLLDGMDPKVLRWVFGISLTTLVSSLMYMFRSELYLALVRIRLGRSLTLAEKISFEVLRVVRRLRRQGLYREEHETMRESIVRWELDQPELAQLLHPLLISFEKANYSPDTVLPEHLLEVKELSRKLSKAVKGRNNSA